MRSLSAALAGSVPACAAIVSAALVTTTTASAQSDAVWVHVSQGTELLATVAAQPLGEVRREAIVPVSSPLALARGEAVSMQPRVRPAARTTLRLPATPIDRATALTIDGFVLRYWKANGTAYVQVATTTADPVTGERETPLTTFALVAGETRDLVEARTFGAVPLTMSASSEPARSATLASRSR